MANNQQGLERHGREDEWRGKGKRTAGWLQRMVGRLTGNRKAQAQGAFREFGGTVQEKGGQVEQKVEQKLDEQDRQSQQAQAQAEVEARQKQE